MIRPTFTYFYSGKIDGVFFMPIPFFALCSLWKNVRWRIEIQFKSVNNTWLFTVAIRKCTFKNTVEIVKKKKTCQSEEMQFGGLKWVWILQVRCWYVLFGKSSPANLVGRQRNAMFSLWEQWTFSRNLSCLFAY